MKRKIVTSLIVAAGSFALVASSHGQGFVNFLNYASDVNAPVTLNGVNVGSEFTAALLYSLNGGTTYTLLDQASAQAGTAYPTPFLATDGDTAHGAGYFTGPNVAIPGYTSGPISFIVEAYHGSSYATADWKGQSQPFTLQSIATGLEVPGDLVGMQGFELIPEPSAFALAGLGVTGLLIYRRKQALARPETYAS